MKLKIAQVIGLNTDQKAAQVISSVRADDNTFLAVLELTSDDAFGRGRQILSDLEDFYFEFEGSIAEKLNAAFKEALSKFQGGADVSLGLAAISGKALYIIGKGQVEVYLKRTDKLLSLLSVGAPAQLISGFVTPGDRLLFATRSLVSFLNSDLDKSLSLPIDSFEEEVGGKIGTSESEDQGLAGLAIEVVEESVEISSLPSETELVSPGLSNFRSSLLARLPTGGRGRLILGIVLIVIIALGAGYKYKLSRDQKKLAEFNQILQEARDDFNTAKGLASLNPADAKNKLDGAKNKVNKALVLIPADNNAQDLKKQIEQDSASILQQSSVSDFPVFLDMDLVKKNFQAIQMSLSAGKLLLLDPGVKTLVVVDLAKKSNQILAGSDQLGDAFKASLNGGLAFVYSKDKGVLKIDTTNKKIAAVAKKSSDLGKIQDIYGFSGNIYLLDNDKNKIWKYLPTSDGYSDAREYLTKDIKVDFSNALRMQIESSIYVLKNGGEIQRFTKGDKDNFSLSGLPSNIKDPKSFFVSSDTDNLYLLDSGNSRLLILTKTGSYKGQISGAGFGRAADLAVDEVGKKIYLLEGGKIFQVDLK